MFAVRFALLSSFFYALNVSMVPFIYSLGIGAFFFLFFRFTTTFAVSIVMTKSLFSFAQIKQQGLGYWLLLLALLHGIQSWLFVEAVNYMPVGLASVVLYTYPLITYLMYCFSKSKVPDLTTIAMFVMAIVGIAALSQGSDGIQSLIIGLGLAFLSATTLAIILHFTPKVSSMKNWEIVKYTTLLPALTFMVLFLQEGGSFMLFTNAALWCLLAGILFSIGMFFYYTAIREYGPTRTANIGYSEPLIVLIIGFIAYTDTITLMQYIGIVLVGIASTTIERRQLRQNTNSEL